MSEEVYKPLFTRDAEFYTFDGVYEYYTKMFVEKFADDIERIHQQNAETCMTLGSGNGVIETSIAKSLFPNLKSITVVSPEDEKHAELLKETFTRELPGVEITVLENSLDG